MPVRKACFIRLGPGFAQDDASRDGAVAVAKGDNPSGEAWMVARRREGWLSTR